MDQRFSLDSDSFERLLAAAWVLQCERDQRLHERLLDAITEGRKSVVEGVRAIASGEAVPGKVADSTEPAVEPNSGDFGSAKPPRIPSQSVTGTIHSTLEIAGTLALAKAPRWTVGRVSGIALVPGTGSRLSSGNDSGSVDSSTTVPAAKPSWAPQAIWMRAVNFRIGRRALLSALPPAAILLIIFAFLVSLMLKTEPSRNVPDAVTQGAQMSDASIQRETVSPERGRPVHQLQTSHMRITDAEAASAVQALSRFEIRGLQRQAKYGDDSAAFMLGMAYEIGRYVPQSCAQAAKLVRTAAESGNAPAQFNMGLRYRDGDGVLADARESAKWLARANRHGYRQTEVSVEEQ